jgi:cell division protein FtsB
VALKRLNAGTAARFALIVAAGYYAIWGGQYSVFDLVELDRQRASHQAELARLRTDVDSLRVVAQKIDSDPATIERVARERFGMIRSGETLVRFVPVADAPTQAP